MQGVVINIATDFSTLYMTVRDWMCVNERVSSCVPWQFLTKVGKATGNKTEKTR